MSNPAATTRPTPDSAPGAETERTLGQLVASATQDIQILVRSEIELAKAEVSAGAKSLGKGIGMFVAAGALVFFALIYLLHALAWGLHETGLGLWACYLIVGGLFLLVAVVLAIMGRSALQRGKVVPQRAIDEAKETVATVKPGNR